MDVPVAARKTGATVLGSNNTCRLLEICGVPADQIRHTHPGDTIHMDGFKIEVYPSSHIRMPVYRPGELRPSLRPPLRLADYRMDECFSYGIETDGLRLLIWSGDSADGAVQADVLFTNFMSPPAFYHDLLARVQPAIVIPIHWDNLFRPLSRPLRPSWRPPRLGLPAWFRARPEAFIQTVQRCSPASRAFVPEIFKPYSLIRTGQGLQIILPVDDDP